MNKATHEHTEQMVWIWLLVNKESKNCHNKLDRLRYQSHLRLISSIFTSYTLHSTHLYCLTLILLYPIRHHHLLLIVSSPVLLCFVFLLVRFYIQVLHTPSAMTTTTTTKYFYIYCRTKHILNIRVCCCYSHTFCRRLLRTFCVYTWI